MKILCMFESFRRRSMFVSRTCTYIMTSQNAEYKHMPNHSKSQRKHIVNVFLQCMCISCSRCYQDRTSIETLRVLPKLCLCIHNIPCKICLIMTMWSLWKHKKNVQQCKFMFISCTHSSICDKDWASLDSACPRVACRVTALCESNIFSTDCVFAHCCGRMR